MPQPQQRNESAIHAADLAVKRVFFMLGVDVDNAESVENFRQDLRFGRNLRKLSNHALLSFAGLLMLGVATAIWTGILSLSKR